MSAEGSVNDGWICDCDPFLCLVSVGDHGGGGAEFNHSQREEDRTNSDVVG